MAARWIGGWVPSDVIYQRFYRHCAMAIVLHCLLPVTRGQLKFFSDLW
ncbi:hypothetical protein ACP4OV_023194 [Aristida adscensionis]